MQKNTPFAPNNIDEYFVLQDKSTEFTVNYQKNVALKQLRTESVCVEYVDENEVFIIDKMLIIELKKYGFIIERQEMNQA